MKQQGIKHLLCTNTVSDFTSPSTHSFPSKNPSIFRLPVSLSKESRSLISLVIEVYCRKEKSIEHTGYLKMFFSLKPIIILALTLTAIASPITNPTVEETNILVTRAQKKDVDCNGQRFTVADINNALRQAKVVEKAKEDGATDYGDYPKVNNNHENLFSSTSTLYEYPLVSGTFSGSKLALLGYLCHIWPSREDTRELMDREHDREWPPSGLIPCNHE